MTDLLASKADEPTSRGGGIRAVWQCLHRCGTTSAHSSRGRCESSAGTGRTPSSRARSCWRCSSRSCSPVRGTRDRRTRRGDRRGTPVRGGSGVHIASRWPGGGRVGRATAPRASGTGRIAQEALAGGRGPRCVGIGTKWEGPTAAAWREMISLRGCCTTGSRPGMQARTAAGEEERERGRSRPPSAPWRLGFE
jgi:hypothetical protein